MSDRVEAAAPFPANVRAFTTLRHGAGGSAAPFDTFNLGNCRPPDGDDPAVVMRNRAELVARFGLPSAPCWLTQVHGVGVVRFGAGASGGPPSQPFPRKRGKGSRLPPPPAGEGWGGGPPADGSPPEADASITSTPGVVLAILTADCLPVVFATKDGGAVAAAHAGWPGLSKGVLEATLAAMRAPPADVVAWIGPCAGPARYEVGRNVFDAFVARDAAAAGAFAPTREGHWLADLPALARRRLVAAGMAAADVHGGGLCTISDPARFFSHRRDGRSGRMATIVWRS